MSLASPPFLTTTLLKDLHEHWRVQEVPILQHLRPGLSNNEMDSLTSELGLELQGEARVWWGWHDGALSQDSDGSSITGRMWAYAPLANMVERTKLHRAGLAANDAAGYPPLWRPSWMTLSSDGTGSVLAIDCDPLRRGITPVYYVGHGAPSDEDLFTPVARSMGEMVTWWIESLSEGGHTHYSPQDGWQYDDDRVDPVRELTGLV